jgi:hypothetical protein
VADHRDAIARLGGGVPRIHERSLDGVQSTTVVEIKRERSADRRSSHSRRG